MQRRVQRIAGSALLLALLLAAAGCGRPHPGTWWGVRHIRGAVDGGNGGARAEQPSGPPPGGEYVDTAEYETYDDGGYTESAYSETPPAEPVAAGAPRDDDFNRAVELVRQHQFEEAKALFRRVLQKRPNFAEAYRWLGDCHYNLLDLDQAIAAYDKAREIDPNNYFALRGKGFAYLHAGHQHWNDQNLEQAHESYRRALELLQESLRLFPADSEAMYGRAMAAEGASRKLYAQAVRLKRAGQDQEAEVLGRNALEVIDEGIQAAKFRISVHMDEVGPRALVGGLFLRRAMLLHEFALDEQAVADLRKAIETQRSILREVDSGNEQARREMEKAEQLLASWQTG